MASNSQTFDIVKVDADGRAPVADLLAVEEPLEIQLVTASAAGAAARSISITMRTPGADRELALGFLYTEGILDSNRHAVAVDELGEPDAETGAINRIRVELAEDADVDLERLERHFYTTSSCGVCGKASLEALHAEGIVPAPAGQPLFTRDTLNRLSDRLRAEQAVFAQTGGLHAATAFGPDGEIVVVREDVGRHNATDKVVGALLAAGQLPASELGMLVSGRASFELIQKTLVAGMPLLAAVGAPSSLAVRTAREFGMTLVGFLRDGRFNVYSGEERIG